MIRLSPVCIGILVLAALGPVSRSGAAATNGSQPANAAGAPAETLAGPPADAAAGSAADAAAGSPAGAAAGSPAEAAEVPIGGPPADEPASETFTIFDYVLPDVPPAGLVHETQKHWMRPVIAIVGDYTVFDQDAASLEQVGKQADTRDLRAARLGILARSKSAFPWEVNFTVDYQEPRTRDDATFRLYDLRLRLPLERVAIDIGKQKQPFVYEVIGLSILNPQQERILSPFFVTRSIGIKASGEVAGERMTWGVGWFNDWLETDATFSDNANDWVGRLTGLALVSPDNRDYLHLGLAIRRAGPDAGMVRLSGKPESNVADRYLDTGEFQASHVGEVGLELAWDRGPFLLIAEHVTAHATAPESGDPRFSGSYLTLSWMLTGESRPYNRATGTTGAIVPMGRRGAIEIVARYSRIDLSDGPIDGGILGKWHLGANWWASRQWKLGLSYGDADLDRDGTVGRTQMLLLRTQWLY